MYKDSFKYVYSTFLLYNTVPPISCSQSCRCYNNSQLKGNNLNCTNTGIKSLSDIYVPKDINWIIAKHNKISHLEWSQYLYQMNHINLANSNIHSIDSNFFSKLANFTNLRYLNLADNKMKVFNKNISHLRIPEIHLSGNPIECNCDMFWFAEWLNATVYHNTSVTGPRIVRDYEDIRCVGGEWNGFQVNKLSKEQMYCFPTVREL